ncbi:hypothetical protein VUR80DRAFT_232 [Thermomyces stellatus]
MCSRLKSRAWSRGYRQPQINREAHARANERTPYHGSVSSPPVLPTPVSSQTALWKRQPRSSLTGIAAVKQHPSIEHHSWDSVQLGPLPARTPRHRAVNHQPKPTKVRATPRFFETL